MEWKEVLHEYRESDQYKKLEKDVLIEYAHHQCFPPKDKIYNALHLTPYDNVRCVIISQDPYHNHGQAMGLAFSVPKGIAIPPSLQNIYKEIKAEYGYDIPTHGDLTSWAEQGVLLLNTILTVRAHQPASHKSIGWETCTDEIIKAINAKEEPVVFMLWGNFAKAKASLITNPKHLVLTAGHPSPLSVRYFSGCNHFKKCNEFLAKNNITEIDWHINE